MLDKYKIQDTEYINPSKEYLEDNLYQGFSTRLIEFKNLIKSDIKNKNTKTYYKFGDGDYYFLKKEPRGSAKPGIRALKKPYTKINHEKFVYGSKKNDIYMSLMTKMHQGMFYELFSNKPDYPSEFVYGLTANKWLLQETSKKIGLIGASNKLELISLLIEKEEYKNYLGIDKFSDYIEIPQRFACDNLKKTTNSVLKQIKRANSEIFLVGIGHVKSGLLHELKSAHNSVYVDVGVGIDALAGIVNLSRPYFGKWTNFQFKNLKLYNNIDFLVNKNNNVKNIKYLL